MMAVFNIRLEDLSPLLLASITWPNTALFLVGYYAKAQNCTMNQQVQDHPGKPAWKMQP